jgi:hypothetical protein
MMWTTPLVAARIVCRGQCCAVDTDNLERSNYCNVEFIALDSLHHLRRLEVFCVDSGARNDMVLQNSTELLGVGELEKALQENSGHLVKGRPRWWGRRRRRREACWRGQW